MKPDIVIKSFKSKKGNSVQFRYPKKEDFSDMWSFACEIGGEDTFVTLNHAPSEEEEHTFFNGMMDAIAKKNAVYLMAYVNGFFAGNARVSRGMFRHTHVGAVGISLRNKYRGDGIGTELMKSLIDEARGLGLRLLTLSCFENNPKALHVYEKLGFTRSGITPGAIFYKDSYIGEVHYYLPLEV